MPKGSPELTSARKEEIISACRKLYETMSFKGSRRSGSKLLLPVPRSTIILRQRKKSSWLCLHRSMNFLPRIWIGFLSKERCCRRMSFLPNWPMRWNAGP